MKGTFSTASTANTPTGIDSGLTVVSHRKASRSNWTSFMLQCALALLPAPAQAQFLYTTNNGAITISGYSGAGGAVTIPASINGLPVTSIGNRAFESSTTLTDVTIPGTVTRIGDGAFSRCTRLATVTIAKGVTTIGQYAFERCIALTGVTIPHGVKFIGYEAFIECTSLTNAIVPESVTNIELFAFLGCSRLPAITVDAGNPAYCSVDGVLFTRNQAGLIQCPGAKSGTYVIPPAVRWIGSEAFYGCSGLTNVVIGPNVSSVPIGGGAVFFECTSLTTITVDADNSAYSSVDGVLFSKDRATLIQYPFGRPGPYTIPDGTITVGETAFYQCAGVTSVILPSSVTRIESGAFETGGGCVGLYFEGNAPQIVSAGWQTLYYLPGTSGWDGILGTAFWDKATRIGYATDGKSLTIKGYAAGGELAVPKTLCGLPVTGIGDRAFNANTSLISITIPDTVTNIAQNAFSGCTGLTSVTIPDTVADIGNEAFRGCPNLTNLTLPNSVTSIGDYAFFGCASLPSVTIPNGVTNIGMSAFASCGNLANVTIPMSTTGIGGGAFSECPRLTAILVHTNNPAYSSLNGVLFDKGRATLIQCPQTKAGIYVIPESVTSLSGSISFGHLGWGAFWGCTGLTGVTMGNSVTNIGAGAFCGCTGLTDLTMPASLKSIGPAAFGGCDNLKHLYFEGNAPDADWFVITGAGITVYRLPGTQGWKDESGRLPTALWLPSIENNNAPVGVQTNGFGLTVRWAGDKTVIVEFCGDLAKPAWFPMSTNTLAGGRSHLTDPQWANQPHRFYRVRAQ